MHFLTAGSSFLRKGRESQRGELAISDRHNPRKQRAEDAPIGKPWAPLPLATCNLSDFHTFSRLVRLAPKVMSSCEINCFESTKGTENA